MENTDFYINNGKDTYYPLTVNAVYHVTAYSQYNIGHSKINKSYVLIITTGGSGTIIIDDKMYLLESNHVFIFDASRYDFDYHSNDNWNFWWIEFEDISDTFIESELQKSYYHPLTDMEQNMLFGVLDYLKFDDSKTSSYLFTSLVCLIQKDSYDIKNGLEYDEKLKMADMFIRKNISTATPENVAEYLNVSKRTLFNIFKRELGISPNDYIKDMKLNRAKYIIKTTDTSIKDVAEFLGYADQFTFSKSFKQHFNISPNQYRNTLKFNQ